MVNFQKVDELLSECLTKWQGKYEMDSKLEDVSGKFKSWEQQIPDKDKELIYSILRNLEYYSRAKANNYLEELHTKLCSYNNPDKKKLTDNNTVYAFIKDKDGQTNSSNDYWTEYKSINGVNRHICYEDITKINAEQWDSIDYIVFIDDFSGSGDSIFKEIEKFKDTFSDKTIYFLTLTIMEQALEAINQVSENSNFEIIPIFIDKQGKVFCRDLFNDNEKERESLCNLSKKLRIPKGDRLGYKESESLVAFYNNTPTNTLGIIRYTTEKYIPLFPRHNDEKPSWQKSAKKKEDQNKANYINKTNRGKGGNV